MKTTMAIQATVNNTKFAVAICEALGVDPNQVTRMVIVIDPVEPLKVTCDLLGGGDLLEVDLPTIEAEERQILMESYRARVERLR